MPNRRIQLQLRKGAEQKQQIEKQTQNITK